MEAAPAVSPAARICWHALRIRQLCQGVDPDLQRRIAEHVGALIELALRLDLQPPDGLLQAGHHHSQV